MSDYLAGEAEVLDAGRALEAALEAGDPFEIQIAAHELLSTGQAREDSLGTVAGFRAEEGVGAKVDPDAELQQILSELDVAQTLLAAGAAVDDPGQTAAARPAELPLSEALDQLEQDRQGRRVGEPAKGAFSQRTDAILTPETFRTTLDTFLDDVVSRTTSITSEAIKGLATLPASFVQPWIGVARALGEVPVVGALARLGMRALLRAVNALQRLIPQAVREKVAGLVKQWWDESGASGLTRRLLAVEEVQQHADRVLAHPPDDARLQAAADSVAALSARHEKTSTTIKRILVVLTAAIGPLVATFTAAAAWLYAAAAAGFVAAVSGAFWIGRDCLDTGAGWERLDGARVVLDRLS